MYIFRLMIETCKNGIETSVLFLVVFNFRNVKKIIKKAVSRRPMRLKYQIAKEKGSSAIFGVTNRNSIKNEQIAKKRGKAFAVISWSVYAAQILQNVARN